MSQFDEKTETLWASIFLMAFGLGTLLFLSAIEREEWFHIRPASGVAAAMFYASDNAADGKAKAR